MIVLLGIEKNKIIFNQDNKSWLFQMNPIWDQSFKLNFTL